METAIEAFGVSIGVHALMNTAWAWPIAESLHFIGLALLIGTVGLFDLRMLGLAKSIPMAALHKLVPWGVGGFVLNAMTGTLFFLTDTDQYLYNPAFQLKVLCMLIAGLNMGLFYSITARHVKLAPAGVDAPLLAKAMAFVSLSCWAGVIAFGRLITFYRPPEHWCFWC